MFLWLPYGYHSHQAGMSSLEVRSLHLFHLNVGNKKSVKCFECLTWRLADIWSHLISQFITWITCTKENTKDKKRIGQEHSKKRWYFSVEDYGILALWTLLVLPVWNARDEGSSVLRVNRNHRRGNICSFCFQIRSIFWCGFPANQCPGFWWRTR